MTVISYVFFIFLCMIAWSTFVGIVKAIDISQHYDNDSLFITFVDAIQSESILITLGFGCMLSLIWIVVVPVIILFLMLYSISMLSTFFGSKIISKISRKEK